MFSSCMTGYYILSLLLVVNVDLLRQIILDMSSVDEFPVTVQFIGPDNLSEVLIGLVSNKIGLASSASGKADYRTTV